MSPLRVFFWIFVGMIIQVNCEHVGGVGEWRGGESVLQTDSPTPGDTDTSTSVDVNSAESSDFTDVNMAMRNETGDAEYEYVDAREEFEPATGGALSRPAHFHMIDVVSTHVLTCSKST